MKTLRRMDEMEMSINLRAIRFAWIYSLLFLSVWIGSDWLGMGLFNGIAFILAMSQLMVYWTVHLFMGWKLGRNEE